MPVKDPVSLRVYSESDGKVYLLREPQNWRVKVDTPVTELSLETAFMELAAVAEKENHHSRVAIEGESEASATPQQLANRQIKALLQPPNGGFRRFVSRANSALFEGFLVVALALVAIVPVYKLVQWSQENLPSKLHLVVLFVCGVVLALSIYVIVAPERFSDQQYRSWFGKHGLLILSCFNLVGAASVFASLTFWLYNQNQWVNMQPCAGRPVSPGSLLDFYMWHLLKLVPFLRLNETLKWGEPLCYTQARVGALVLLFQALVVLPCINAIRYSWKNRKRAEAKPYKYIYEPGWKPENDLKQ
jgi:hypothetical protein